MSARLLLTLLAAVAATSLGVMMAVGQVTLNETSSCGPLPSSGNYTDGSQYEKNLAELLTALQPSAAAAAAGNGSFHSGSVGSAAPDQVWGLTMCYADSNPTRCQDCLGTAASIDGLTELCPLAPHMRGAALSVSDAGRLRYADVPFLGSADTGDFHQSSSWSDVGVADVASMNTMRRRLLNQLADSAAAGGGNGQAGQPHQRLAYGGLPYTDARNGSQVVVYGLAQCTEDLEPSECTRCFAFLFANMGMTNASGGSISVFSCYLRYQVNDPIDFIGGPAPSPQPSVHDSSGAAPPPLGSKGSKAPLIVAVLAAAAGAVMLLVAGV